MKTNLRKLVKFIAAGLFLIALAINVKVTLEDPFVMLSEQAIATNSGTEDTQDSGTEDTRYLGTGWGTGYSWSKQPDLTSSTTGESVSIGVSFSDTGVMTLSSGATYSSSSTITWIDCCNPSNSNSQCNFGSNSGNCSFY